jgi:uncharacterized protein involved in outer membrane biogenesis
MRRVLKLLGFLIISLVLGIVASALAVYQLVRAGEVQRYLTDEIEKRTELRAQVGRAELEIGWISGIAFNNLALSEPQATGPVITAERVTARVALMPLFRRQVIFYEIRLQKPAAQFVRDPEGRLPLLDKLLNLQFFKQQAGELTLDLRSIKIQGGDFGLIDQRRKGSVGEWRIENIDLDIYRVRGQRLANFLKRQPANTEVAEAAAVAFALKSDVLRDGRKMSVKADGQLAFPEKSLEFHKGHWNGNIEVVNIPAALVRDYLGERLPIKSMGGYFAQRIHVEGNPLTLLRIKGAVEFRQFSIDAPELFLTPLNGLDGRATVALDQTPQQVRITQADFRGRELNFSLQGVASALDGNDPHLRGSIAVMPAPAATLVKYLPVKVARSLQLENAVKMIQAGELEIIKASVDATVSQLLASPQISTKHMSLQAELRDLAGTPNIDGALPVRGVTGNINLANGVLAFANFRGSYGDSRFSEVAGRYDVAGAASGKLDVTGRGDINLGELKEQLSVWSLPKGMDGIMSSVQELSGYGKINLALTRVPNTPIQFDGKAVLERTRIRYGDFAIGDLHGELVFTPTEIRSEQLEAQLAGSPIQIRLALKDYSAEDGTFDLTVHSTGIQAGVVSSLLLDGGSARADGVVRGSVRYFGPFRDKNRRKFTGDFDLVDVHLLVRPLLQPLQDLNGKIKIDDTGIDFQNLRTLLVGVPATASGRWRYTGRPQLRFDFAAPNLDITYLISQIDPESSEFYVNLVADGKISLNKGRIKNFDFNDLTTHATIDHRVWRLTDLSAKSAGGTIQGLTTIFDKPETLAVVSEPRVQGVPVQSFLKWFDITNTEMTGKVTLGGKLETSGRNDVERKQNLNGAFNMKIEDGTINRMRVVVQILNLLDLSRWFSFQFPDLTKEGIRFRAITGDFKVVKGVYSTENLVVDSNDLRMTGAGKIDVPKNEVDFVVAVRPFAGIDTALNYIPLLGRGVAAIKNSFLVASFNIQGSVENPTITPAPLDTLAGWFWGVLGIPKNMIGWGEGEKKEHPGAAPETLVK